MCLSVCVCVWSFNTHITNSELAVSTHIFSTFQALFQSKVASTSNILLTNTLVVAFLFSITTAFANSTVTITPNSSSPSVLCCPRAGAVRFPKRACFALPRSSLFPVISFPDLRWVNSNGSSN